jgi:cytoskeletal protein RodZ
MMRVSHIMGRSMPKATVLVFLSLFSVLAAAQTPANKNKAAVKPKMSASEEATAAAQAAAIAQAAALLQATSPAPVQASAQTQSPAQPAAQATAQPPLTAAVAVKPQPMAAQPAVRVSASGAAPHDTVSAEELAIAQRVHQGHLPCELGTSIRVEHDAVQPGYFNVHGKGFRYRMRPVPTSTGAIRLEDAKAGAVWLQLANKSMLMDQKKGRRVADECAHPEQLAYAESMKTNPPPKLFDTTGMGR